MFTVEFTPTDLAKIRLAVSPLLEIWQSVRALQNPAARTLHPAWNTGNSAKLHGRVGDRRRVSSPPRVGELASERLVVYEWSIGSAVKWRTRGRPEDEGLVPRR